MELKEFKDKLLNNKNIPLPLIINAYNNNFLVSTYICAVAKNMHLNIKYAHSLNEINDIVSSMFYDNDLLFVLKANKEDIFRIEDIKSKNIIILYEEKANETDEKIEKINFCKMEDWMVEEYAFKLLPGLEKEKIKWLCKICNYNVERVHLECQKINIFEKEKQSSIFDKIINEEGYSDLSCNTLFDFNNAIIKKDILGIKKSMKELEATGIESFSLISILIKNFSNIINIQMGKNVNADKLGLSEKQFKVFYYNCNKFNNNKLIFIYKFLNSIDYKLKSGFLNIENSNLIQYILNNII